MRPKKLKEEQHRLVKRASDKHTMFTFDMVHPFYFVKENLFKDPKKNMLVYFDEKSSHLVHIKESKDEKMDSNSIEKWVKNYHKVKKNNEKEKQLKREAKRLEREKKRKENKLEIERSSKELEKSKTTTRKTKTTPKTTKRKTKTNT